jgi:hypothetical protein
VQVIEKLWSPLVLGTSRIASLRDMLFMSFTHSHLRRRLQFSQVGWTVLRHF